MKRAGTFYLLIIFIIVSVATCSPDVNEEKDQSIFSNIPKGFVDIDHFDPYCYLSYTPITQILTGGEIFFCGVLTIENIDKLKLFIKQNDHNKKLRLRSIGGKSASTAFFANDIQQQGFSLTLDGVCASACIEFIFNVDELTLTNNTVIHEHGNFIGEFNYLMQAARSDGVFKKLQDNKEFTKYFGAHPIMSFRNTLSLWHTIYQKRMAPMEIECMGQIINDEFFYYKDGVLVVESKYDDWIMPHEFVNDIRKIVGFDSIKTPGMNKKALFSHLDYYSKAKKYHIKGDEKTLEKYNIRIVEYAEMEKIYQKQKHIKPRFCLVE